MGRVVEIAALSIAIVATCAAAAAQVPTPAVSTTPTTPTFTKHVAPIFQRSCQSCHREGSIAPMSLVTYAEARPWARSIKEKVSNREMPPWFIDRHIGIRQFKNDISLSDQEIATIVGWVDAGAPMGNPADMPPAIQFPDVTAWQTGKPDLVVEMLGEHVVRADGPDWWGSFDSGPAVGEDRWIKAVEIKPIKGYRAVHHAGASIAEGDGSEGGFDRRMQDGGFNSGTLSMYSAGKNGDVYPEGMGRLLPAGAKIRFDVHLHPMGADTPVKVAVAFQFYPRGYVPKYQTRTWVVNGDKEPLLDIPANTDNIRFDTFVGLTKPMVITAFEPHMHSRGKAQCVEALYPPGTLNTGRAGGVKTEMLSCVDRFDFQWLRSYAYADEVAPILPAGTILHIMSWYNNTATNKNNSDPTNWVGFGNRAIDDMSHVWLIGYEITHEEYKQRVAERTRTSNASR